MEELCLCLDLGAGASPPQLPFLYYYGFFVSVTIVPFSGYYDCKTPFYPKRRSRPGTQVALACCKFGKREKEI